MSVRKKLKQQQQQLRQQPQLIQVLPQELQHHLQHLQQQHPQLHQYDLQHPQEHLNNNNHHQGNNNNNVQTTVRVYPHHYYYNPTMLNQGEQAQAHQHQYEQPQQQQHKQFSRRHQQRFFVSSKPAEVIADCHSEDISNLLELTDGTLVTTSYDRSIRRWTRQGQHLQTFWGHAEGVLGIAQIDERTIASCSIDRMVRFWDLETATCISTLDGHQLAVHCVLKLRHQHQYEDLTKSFERSNHRPTPTSSSSFVWTSSESGRGEGLDKKKTMVATGSMDATIRIYILEDQTLMFTFHEHTSTVRALCELKDGTLISGSHDCTVKVWNLHEWRCERTLRGHSSWVLAVVPIGSIYNDDDYYEDDNDEDGDGDDDDEDDDHRQSSYGRGRRRSSSSSSGGEGFRGGRARGKTRKRKTPQSLFVASSSVDETIMIWNVKTGECLRTLVGHSNPIEAVFRLNNADRKPVVPQHYHYHDHHLTKGHRHPRIYDKLKQHQKKLSLQRMRMRANPREGEYDEQQQHHIDLTVQQQPQQEVGVDVELNDIDVIDASDDDNSQEEDIEEEEEVDEEEEDQLLGELLASGSADGELRVWDVRTGECLDACQTGGRVIALIGLRGEVCCSIATTVNGWENKQKNIEIRRTWNRQRSLVHASSWVVARNCASDAVFESLKRVLPDEVFQLLSLCYQHLRPSYVPPQHILSSSSSSPSLSKTPTPTFRTTSSSTSTSPSPSSYSQPQYQAPPGSQHQYRPTPPHNHHQ